MQPLIEPKTVIISSNNNNNFVKNFIMQCYIVCLSCYKKYISLLKHTRKILLKFIIEDNNNNCFILTDQIMSKPLLLQIAVYDNFMYCNDSVFIFCSTPLKT